VVLLQSLGEPRGDEKCTTASQIVNASSVEEMLGLILRVKHMNSIMQKDEVT